MAVKLAGQSGMKWIAEIGHSMICLLTRYLIRIIESGLIDSLAKRTFGQIQAGDNIRGKLAISGWNLHWLSCFLTSFDFPYSA
jgi:triacylglycerol esterase/lipase EstA (alpha/beta hydrolase family)